MDGRCKFETVFMVSQMYGWMDGVSLSYRKDGWMEKCKFEIDLW